MSSKARGASLVGAAAGPSGGTPKAAAGGAPNPGMAKPNPGIAVLVANPGMAVVPKPGIAAPGAAAPKPGIIAASAGPQGPPACDMRSHCSN